jgi:lysyl-tRNA synthetase class I
MVTIEWIELNQHQTLKNSSHKMLLVADWTNIKPFYILNFSSFSAYFLLSIVSAIVAQILNLYAPKYETAGNFWFI